jgi:hypothetical protein
LLRTSGLDGRLTRSLVVGSSPPGALCRREGGDALGRCSLIKRASKDYQ